MWRRRSARSAATTRRSDRRATAATGSSASRPARGAGAASSRACAGRASTRSPTRSQHCRGGGGWRCSRRSRTSTTRMRTGAGACRSVAGDGLQMLLKARHELDEVARAVPVVELVADDVLPAVAAGAGRAGEREEVGAARDARRGAALDRRGADLLIAEPAEELAEARDLLLVDGVEGLGRHVAAGDAGAPGRDHHVDLAI